MFEKLVWQHDRMLLDGWVFRLEHFRNDTWELGDECFSFYKIKALVDQYAQFWQNHPSRDVSNIFEIGIWDGGSMAFWFEYLQPKKHVGIDLSPRGDSDYFKRYVTSKGLAGRIETYWGVDQSDSKQLTKIVNAEFDSPLDLVIDDGSHLYQPTKASLETLFPLLRPGGLYIIEDWAWAHWRDFHSLRQSWATEKALTDLVVEVVEAAGSSTELVASVSVFQGFAAIERGEISRQALGNLKLKDHIVHRPYAARWLQHLSGTKRVVKHLLNSRRFSTSTREKKASA